MNVLLQEEGVNTMTFDFWNPPYGGKHEKAWINAINSNLQLIDNAAPAFPEKA